MSGCGSVKSGGGGSHHVQSSHSSQESSKAKGGSGEKCGGSGEKAKGGSGEKGPWWKRDGELPPGLQKKVGSRDGFDGGAAMGMSASNDYLDNYIQGLLSSSGSSQSQTVTGPKYDPNAPPPYSGINGSSGVNGSNGLSSNGVNRTAGSPSLPDITGAVNAQAKPLPFVDQYNPVGKDGSYLNGDMNCGPALLASIAKSRGQTGGLTDAQLITQLGKTAGTTAEGTSGNGMIAGLADLGMQTTARAGSDLNWINSQLAQGHDVLANGDFYSVPGRIDPNQVAGHYIAVTGVNNGIYSVTDPAGGSISMTAAQLDAFIKSHPQGGFTIAAW